MALKKDYSESEIESLVPRYLSPSDKIECSPNYTKYLLVTHPVQFITTIGRVNGRLVPNIAPFATCLDTSYDPPYVTFSCALRQHAIQDQPRNNSKMNTYLNIRQNRLFIVNTPDISLLSKLDVVAFPYQRRNLEDKIKLAGLTMLSPLVLPHRHRVYPPVIKECLAHLECEVIDIHRPRGSDHYNITGHVIGACYDESLGNNIDEIRYNLVKRIFHHFGSSNNNRSTRFIGNITPSSINTITFQLEENK